MEERGTRAGVVGGGADSEGQAAGVERCQWVRSHVLSSVGPNPGLYMASNCHAGLVSSGLEPFFFFSLNLFSMTLIVLRRRGQVSCRPSPKLGLKEFFSSPHRVYGVWKAHPGCAVLLDQQTLG